MWNCFLSYSRWDVGGGRDHLIKVEQDKASRRSNSNEHLYNFLGCVFLGLFTLFMSLNQVPLDCPHTHGIQPSQTRKFNDWLASSPWWKFLERRKETWRWPTENAAWEGQACRSTWHSVIWRKLLRLPPGTASQHLSTFDQTLLSCSKLVWLHVFMYSDCSLAFHSLKGWWSINWHLLVQCVQRMFLQTSNGCILSYRARPEHGMYSHGRYRNLWKAAAIICGAVLVQW